MLLTGGRWNCGPAVLRSRAGMRILVSLVGAGFFLLALWVYYGTIIRTGDGGGGSSKALPLESNNNDKQTPGGLGGLAEDSLPIAQPQTPPAWIDTPPAFYVRKGEEKDGTITTTTTTTTTASLGRPLALKNARLLEALEGFLARPVLSHENAVGQNEVACPRAQLDRQVNADQLGGERAKWLAVDEAEIVRMRREAVAFLEEKAKEATLASEYGKDWHREEGLDGGEVDALIGPGLGPDRRPVERGSRGVVIAAGNHRTVERAIASIKEMRRLGWSGGVEVWHFEGELTAEGDRQALEGLGVGIHMVSTPKSPGQWKNFELKAEAIARSSFDEVLYLDSDNFALGDITPLFSSPLFRDQRGGQAVFWPDLNRDHPDNAVHRVLGVPCHDAWELDSGQMLVAKSGNGGLNLAALWLAVYMQTEGGYWFSGGDKDTFRYAHLALGIPYTPAPCWLALLGNTFRPRQRQGGSGSDAEIFCGGAMLQYGLDPPHGDYVDASDTEGTHPEPLFVHANLLKHQSGVPKGGAFTLMRRLKLVQDQVRVGGGGSFRNGGDDDDDDGDDKQQEQGEKRKRPLDTVVGGAKDIAGRGLCSDIWTFEKGNEAEIETVDARMVFSGAMETLEERYFGAGVRPGGWK